MNIIYLDKDDITFLYNYILKIASGESNLEECRAWFAENVVETLV